MPHLPSIDDFLILQRMLVSDRNPDRPHLVVCAGTACQASGSNGLVRILKKYILGENLLDKLFLRVTGCHGFCEMGPFILTEPQRAFYPHVHYDDAPKIAKALLAGAYVRDLLYRDPVTGDQFYNLEDIPFFKGQKRTLLGFNAEIDPLHIYDYITHGGYKALAQVLQRGDPDSVVNDVKSSGLRGRGGAGFPTGVKWELLSKQACKDGKYLVCNADEGDPGAYMDRAVLEGNPHSVIEGMLIGAYGTGATEGLVYVRNEYPLAIRHLRTARQQARDLGLLGADILGTGLCFDISIIRGVGAFVCGEETALVRSIEGKIGEPRQRPPFPIERGVFGKPTVINNVETWANIPVIFRLGVDEFAHVGTKGNSGTKIFSLVGKIKNTGLVEVPMGTSIADIVYNIGGGSPGKARIKAVQTGGPSGGCIPLDMFHLPIEYESLADAGSIMGSGGMIVMDENTCMVDIAKYYMNFLQDESCGKCFSCRKGTQRLHELLEDITHGCGTSDHLDLLEELALVVKDASMCGLGQTAANPVLSTLKYFGNEYRRHIEDKICDAFVCRELVGAPCQAACPLDTEPWRYIAHIEKGEYEEAYRVIRENNPFPSVCARVCDRKCEHRCRLGTSGDEAIAIRALKRFVTDQVDPSVYKPVRTAARGEDAPCVAIVGAGPCGLSAAHYLSLAGYRVTVFDSESEPGGMLVSTLPAYRLPQEIVRREIETLLDDNITVKCETVFGRDITLESLFLDGFKAVFVAIGAHQSWRLGLDGEDVAGVHPSIDFLKSLNLRGERLAWGHVGIVGGGNSAVDAARVAVRQEKVDKVTLLYRRTRGEMPAYEEEIEAAMEEGVAIETLLSPVKLFVRQEELDAAIKESVELETLVSPIMIHSREGRLISLDCVRNRLGPIDSSGRRRPVPVPGTEFTQVFDTLIVAVGERPDSDCLAREGVEVDKRGRLHVDRNTLSTSFPGVFAGGDVVTGPNTVVDAIAAGKKGAEVIQQYLENREVVKTSKATLPEVFLEPSEPSMSARSTAGRVEPATLPPSARRRNFQEVEMTLSEDQATAEARRCLRCDLEFTRRGQDETRNVKAGEAGR